MTRSWLQIRWRRILFGFHLLVWLIVRLAVGSINEMPPARDLTMAGAWALIVLAHGVLLAILDGRDHAEPPFAWMNRCRSAARAPLVAAASSTRCCGCCSPMAIADRIIPEDTIFRYVVPLSLAWLAHTAFGILHVLLVIYAEVRACATPAEMAEKPKRDLFADETPLLVTDDGELVDLS